MNYDYFLDLYYQSFTYLTPLMVITIIIRTIYMCHAYKLGLEITTLFNETIYDVFNMIGEWIYIAIWFYLYPITVPFYIISSVIKFYVKRKVKQQTIEKELEFEFKKAQKDLEKR